MSLLDRLRDTKTEVETEVEHRAGEMDARVKAQDERLRDKYGIASWLARLVDVGAVVAGVYLVLFHAPPLTGAVDAAVIGIGVLLILGGAFGFLYESPGDDA